MNYYIEQMDKNYVTYLNGEVIDGNKKILGNFYSKKGKNKDIKIIVF